ncbi:MAG: hypothetical protein ABIP36_07005 [Acidimicrobiales bacterium]
MLAELGNTISDADAETLAGCQRHWHGSGQSGCAFAQWMAKRVDLSAWPSLVVRGAEAHEIDAQEIVGRLVGVIDQSRTELVSLLFPAITSTLEAVALIHRLALHEPFSLVDHPMIDCFETFQLRYSLDSTLTAWVMAFGPFGWMPPTRRAPQFELVLRVRPKPAVLYHRLNKDPAVAHLADFPAQLRSRAWDRLFNFTLAETRRMLGGEPTDLTAAKMTFAVPRAILSI